MEKIKLVTTNYAEHPLAQYIQKRYVSQEHAIKALVLIYSKYEVNMVDPTKPFASILMLGPTGVGKTRIVELFTEFVMGQHVKPLKVNCGEFTQEHEVAKLIGSPPGYLGHRESTPIFCKANVESTDKSGKSCNIILLDEIEKAAPKFMSLMLGILDRGELQTGAAEKVDFRNTFIFMTSNLGASKMIKELANTGFVRGESKELSGATLKQVATNEATKFFTAEQFNRIDAVICFNPLDPSDIDKVLDLQISNLKTSLNMNREITLSVSDDVKRKIVAAGYDRRFGARNLKRVMSSLLVEPVSEMIAFYKLRAVAIEAELEDNEIVFYQLRESSMVATANSYPRVESIVIDEATGESVEISMEGMRTEPAIPYEDLHTSYYISPQARDIIALFDTPGSFRGWVWADSENPRMITLEGFKENRMVHQAKYAYAPFFELTKERYTSDGKKHLKLKPEVVEQINRERNGK